MWAAIEQTFLFFQTLASAATNAATAIEKCTKVADQAADNFLMVETAKQAERKLKLEASLKAVQAETASVA